MHIPKNPLHKAPLLFCLWVGTERVTHNLERSEEEPKESTNTATPTSITSLKSLLVCPTKNSVQVFKADSSRTKLCRHVRVAVTLLTAQLSCFQRGRGLVLLCYMSVWMPCEHLRNKSFKTVFCWRESGKESMSWSLGEIGWCNKTIT